jgi:hypothetical protein
MQPVSSTSSSSASNKSSKKTMIKSLTPLPPVPALTPFTMTVSQLVLGSHKYKCIDCDAPAEPKGIYHGTILDKICSFLPIDQDDLINQVRIESISQGKPDMMALDTRCKRCDSLNILKNSCHEKYYLKIEQDTTLQDILEDLVMSKIIRFDDEYESTVFIPYVKKVRSTGIVVTDTLMYVYTNIGDLFDFLSRSILTVDIRSSVPYDETLSEEDAMDKYAQERPFLPMFTCCLNDNCDGLHYERRCKMFPCVNYLPDESDDDSSDDRSMHHYREDHSVYISSDDDDTDYSSDQEGEEGEEGGECGEDEDDGELYSQWVRYHGDVPMEQIRNNMC